MQANLNLRRLTNLLFFKLFQLVLGLQQRNIRLIGRLSFTTPEYIGNLPRTALGKDSSTPKGHMVR